jgi:hypothetical protein
MNKILVASVAIAALVVTAAAGPDRASAAGAEGPPCLAIAQMVKYLKQAPIPVNQAGVHNISNVTAVSLGPSGEVTYEVGVVAMSEADGMIKGNLRQVRNKKASTTFDTQETTVSIYINPKTNEIILGDNTLTDVVCPKPLVPNQEILWGRQIPKKKGMGAVLSSVHRVMSFIDGTATGVSEVK